MPDESVVLTERIKAKARELGFELVGIAPVRESDHGEFYRRWIAEGRHGEMEYLARDDAVARRLDPRSAWPELRSAVVVGLFYGGGGAEAAGNPGAVGGVASGAGGAPGGSSGPGAGDVVVPADPDLCPSGPDRGPAAPATSPDVGIIARYARGRDYHKVMKKKLLELLTWIEGEVGRELPAARAYVDTGPVLERELARRAGFGWFGRNTMLIHPRSGSYFFIGTLLLELELEPDAPFEADRCGRCTACVTACPTGALLGRDATGAPVMDATRCISYLTIENRGPIPPELRPAIGNRIFGCDICQEVCPFNRKFSRPASEPAFDPRGPGEPPPGVERLPSDGWHPGTAAPSLVDLMSMDESGWEAFSRGSALRRAGRAGFRRNVAVALGNWGDESAVPSLRSGLFDPSPLVRSHSAWALGRIGSTAAVAALTEALSTETDQEVIEEIEAALAEASATSSDGRGAAARQGSISTERQSPSIG